MKKKSRILFFAIFLVLFSHIAYSLDKIEYVVTDEAGVISPEYIDYLTAEINDLKIATGAELAVVTVKSLEGEPIEDYSIRLAHGTLGEEGKDNGILVLLATEDREYRIEIGYGLEGILNDAKAGRIGREFMEPYFKEGDYENGLLIGVQKIIDVIKSGDSSSLESTSSNEDKPLNLLYLILITISALIILNIIIGIIRYTYYKNKAGNSSGKIKDNDFMNLIIAASILNNRGKGGFGGGGFSGGGFGGGSFGGGGFSGKF